MNYKDFESLLNKTRIPCDFARSTLSDHLRRLVKGGQYVSLDERLHAWKGDAPCLKVIPRKPNPVGLWVSQLCVRLFEDPPFCFGFYPFDSVKSTGEKITVLKWYAGRHDCKV